MAYAAVTSVVKKTEQILHADGHQILHKNLQLKSLLEKCSFLQSLLDDCSSETTSQAVYSFEEQIMGAAYRAETIIDQFSSRPEREENRNSFARLISTIRNPTRAFWDCTSVWVGDQSFFGRLILAVLNLMPALKIHVLGLQYQDMQKLLQDIDSITEEVMKTKSIIEDLLSRNLVNDGSVGLASSGKSTMVGFDDDSRQIKDQLTGSSSKLETVSIFGMGGIGKTTLARNVYEDPLITQKFDTRAWVTVSAQYHVKDILFGLLNSMKVLTDRTGGESDEELAELLYKRLKGWRYLIVMDDVWESKAWDCVKRSFPDDRNGSRVILTTRLLHVAVYPDSCSSLHQMRFLNENESWNLLRQRIFGEGYCHPKLEEIGNKIARNCLGLPLAIVVIAGLLSKVKKTQYWENVAKNVSSIVTKNEEKFMEILSLSYSHLPHHLKACFLYMGAFPEDSEIPVSKLISLWAAEGFTEQSKTKCSEEVGEEYLQDLIDRSLILVCKRSSTRKIKTCSIHDLLRDLCIRQALSENFLHVAKSNTDLRQAIKTVCRLSIDPYVLFLPETRYTMGSMSLVQTLLCTGTYLINHPVSVDLGFRLMRVLDVVVINFFEFPMEIIELFNLRYLGFTYRGQLPKSISKLLNLETIVHHNWTFGQCPSLPQEIWTMPRLRHLYLTPNFLTDPPTAQIDEENSVRLEHLQTLSEVRGFVCKEEVLERIPNLKKLEISYDPVSSPEGWLYYHLENLVNLHNLETLKLLVKDPPMSRDISPPILAFPPKLKNLTLSGCRIPWEDMTIVGTLPNLEVLKLRNYAFQGAEWETIDGEFCELKFLLIEKTDLVQWTAERTHFPRLERLILKECFRLKEVPSGIGEIDTLNIIELVDCRYSVETSAKQIKEEQESFGNDTLEVRVNARRTFEDKFYTRILR